MSRASWLVGVGIVAAASVVAQKGVITGGATSSGTTTGTSSSTGTSRTTTTNPTPNTNTGQQQQQRPIFVSGRVMVDGEDGIPERVSIERVCTGHTYREGYTDSKGYFSFQLGQNTGIFGDASMDTPIGFGANSQSQQGGNFGSSDNPNNEIWSCELRATLSGFHSETVSLMSRRSMDNPDVGIIMLTRMLKVDGLTTSATIALAPKDVKKIYEKGLNFEKHAKPDEAQEQFLKAVDLDPRHAGAWFELGKVYEQRNHLDEARAAYKKAIAADGNYVNPYERLYLMALHDNQWADAADLTDKVMRLNPYDFPSAYYYNALANAQMQKWDAAEKSAREAAKIRGTRAMPRSLFLLGLAQANRGDLPGSVTSLNTYLQTEPAAGDKANAQKLLGQVQQNLAARNSSAQTPAQ